MDSSVVGETSCSPPLGTGGAITEPPARVPSYPEAQVSVDRGGATGYGALHETARVMRASALSAADHCMTGVPYTNERE
jgi:hypothetical protein